MITKSELKLIGILAKAFINNVRVDDTYNEVLHEYGLMSIKDDDWVSVLTLNEVLTKLVEKRQSFESTYDMVAVGLRAAQNADLPQDMTLIDFLTTQNPVIQEIYQGAGKGSVKMQTLSDTHYILEVDLPWPDDLMYGNYYGYIKRLLPAGTSFTLRKTQASNIEAGIPMIFEIEW